MPSRSWDTRSKTWVAAILGGLQQAMRRRSAAYACPAAGWPSCSKLWVQIVDHALLQVEKPADIMAADKLIFPGVGSFGQAMRILTKKGMVEPLKDYIHVRAFGSDKAVNVTWMQMRCKCVQRAWVGVSCWLHQANLVWLGSPHLLPCVLLLTQSGKAFFGICLGLQLLFDGSDESGGCEGLGIIPGRVTQFDISKGLPVPHIGWNELSQLRPSTLLEGVGGKRVYFVHSYR